MASAASGLKRKKDEQREKDAQKELYEVFSSKNLTLLASGSNEEKRRVAAKIAEFLLPRKTEVERFLKRKEENEVIRRTRANIVSAILSGMIEEEVKRRVKAHQDSTRDSTDYSYSKYTELRKLIKTYRLVKTREESDSNASQTQQGSGRQSESSEETPSSESSSESGSSGSGGSGGSSGSRSSSGSRESRESSRRGSNASESEEPTEREREESGEGETPRGPQQGAETRETPQREEARDTQALNEFLTRSFGISYEVFETNEVVYGAGFTLHKTETGVTLRAGETNIASFNHPTDEAAAVEIEKHFPDALVAGFLHVNGLTQLREELQLGEPTAEDLIATTVFINGLNDKYHKDRRVGTMITANRPIQEYEVEHEIIADVATNLRDNPRAFYVSEDEGAIADSRSMDWLYTVQARSCSILILYDTRTKIGAIAHVSADDIHTDNVNGFVRRFLETIGGDASQVQVYINFGWYGKDAKVILAPLEENGLLEKVTETNLSYRIMGENPPLFVFTRTPGSSGTEDSAAINLQDGTIKYIRVEDKIDAVPGGVERIRQHRRNVGNPEVIIEE